MNKNMQILFVASLCLLCYGCGEVKSSQSSDAEVAGGDAEKVLHSDNRTEILLLEEGKNYIVVLSRSRHGNRSSDEGAAQKSMVLMKTICKKGRSMGFKYFFRAQATKVRSSEWQYLVYFTNDTSESLKDLMKEQYDPKYINDFESLGYMEIIDS